MANVSSSNGLEKRPKLRFPGFDESYRTTPLGEIASLVNRTDPKSNAPIMMLSAGNGFIMQSEKYSRDNAGQSLKKYILLKQGELAYNHGASKAKQFGCCYELTEPEARIPYVYHCFKINDHEYTPFIAMALNNAKMDKQLKRLVSSSVRMDGLLNISFEDYMSVTLHLPSSTEQKHIADFLKKIDERIAAQEKLLASLKKYKRGLLRTVFSEKGSHSLLHDAVSHRIDEVCDVLSGKRIPKGETFSPRPTEYRYITVSDMGEKYISSDTLQFITSHTEKQITRYKVRNGDIIISVAGTLGKLNIITPDLDGVNLTENCDRFTNFRGINPEYLYHVLSSDLIQSQIEASKTKNGQPKLALERIRNFVVPVPHQIRQEQFAGVMNSIDKYIASQQAVLDRCCKARAGLLQQLFI
mgnify:FL=1